VTLFQKRYYSDYYLDILIPLPYICVTFKRTFICYTSYPYSPYFQVDYVRDFSCSPVETDGNVWRISRVEVRKFLCKFVRYVQERRYSVYT
jgi:hypothetical protein